MKRANLGCGLFFFSLSVFVCIEALRFGFGSFAAPGPGFLSFWAGILLVCLSLSLIGRDLCRRPSLPVKSKFERVRWKNWVVTLIGLVGYALFLETLGFILCTFFLIGFLMAFVEPQRFTVILVTAAFTTGASYILFQIILKTQLPAGILARISHQ